MTSLNVLMLRTVKMQALRHWTSRFPPKQCDQKVIVQRPASRPMTILQDDEITQITLQ